MRCTHPDHDPATRSPGISAQVYKQRTPGPVQPHKRQSGGFRKHRRRSQHSSSKRKGETLSRFQNGSRKQQRVRRNTKPTHATDVRPMTFHRRQTKRSHETPDRGKGNIKLQPPSTSSTPGRDQPQKYLGSGTTNTSNRPQVRILIQLATPSLTASERNRHEYLHPGTETVPHKRKKLEAMETQNNTRDHDCKTYTEAYRTHPSKMHSRPQKDGSCQETSGQKIRTSPHTTGHIRSNVKEMDSYARYPNGPTLPSQIYISQNQKYDLIHTHAISQDDQEEGLSHAI